MKRYLLLLLLCCFVLAGCGSEKLVKASSFSNWTDRAIEGKGKVFDIASLDEKEEVQLRLENTGSASAELELSYHDSQKGEVLYKAFRLDSDQRTMLRLRPLDDSRGFPADFTLKVVSDGDSKVFAYGDSYLPKGYSYHMPRRYYNKNLADELKVTELLGEASEVQLPFILSDKVSHLFIEYDGEAGQVAEVGLYRQFNDIEIQLGLAEPYKKLTLENLLVHFSQAEAFYISLSSKDGLPLRGKMTLGLYFSEY